MASNFKIIIL